jgi:hypothetical protein
LSRGGNLEGIDFVGAEIAEFIPRDEDEIEIAFAFGSQ